MKRYLVIVTSREKGKYFTLLDGVIEDSGEGVIDDVHQKIKATGHREWKIRDRIRDEICHHLKHLGQQARKYVYKKDIHVLTGIIIGGHQEFIHLIKKHTIPELHIQIPVVGEFIADVDVSSGALAEKANKAVAIHKSTQSYR